MAKRSLSKSGYTPTGIGDAANLTDTNTGGFIQGSAALQRTNIIEVYLGGEAGASGVNPMLLGFNSTAGGTITLGNNEDAPLDAATAALASAVDVGDSTTGADPQRSATLGHVLNLSFNAFGGIVRWLAAPGEEVSLVGSGVNTGSMSLSCFTGTTPGVMSSHIIYETL